MEAVMLKIGEFSKIVRVSARMLRYYEENGLLKPVEIDRFTGYRLYSMEQISELRRVTELRDAGFNVDEIAEALPRLDDVEYMREALEKKREQICENIAEEQEKLERINELNNRIINNIKENKNMFIGEVELKKLESVKVLAILINTPEGKFHINEEQALWKRMFDYIKENKIEHGIGGYSEYGSNAEYGSQVMIAAPVNNADKEEFKSINYLSCYAHDKFSYAEIVGLPLAATIKYSGNIREGYQAAMGKIVEWMQANGYQFFSGNVADGLRCYRIETPLNEENPDDYLTEMQIAVEKV
jgi:DNA-binding transcriptional MerR regulator/effector-binding domain-containing protein